MAIFCLKTSKYPKNQAIKITSKASCGIILALVAKHLQRLRTNRAHNKRLFVLD